jgi:SAM-dependent MidA family methyltransferase
MVMSFGPVSQAEFLKELGIEVRLMRLLSDSTPEQAEQLISSFKRLMYPNEMGELFKAFAIAHHAIVPSGFRE